ncbi:MAG: hypothetical protein L6Q69_22475 [Zoogloea sp.]|nr:hypothetical protein [Zoogloea sp.]
MSTQQKTSGQPGAPLQLVAPRSEAEWLRHRVQLLEGQMNAMAQAWLYLAAEVEMQGGFSLEQMEESLKAKRWPTCANVNDDARNTIYWLCHELSAARNVRAARRRDGEG